MDDPHESRNILWQFSDKCVVLTNKSLENFWTININCTSADANQKVLMVSMHPDCLFIWSIQIQSSRISGQEEHAIHSPEKNPFNETKNFWIFSKGNDEIELRDCNLRLFHSKYLRRKLIQNANNNIECSSKKEPIFTYFLCRFFNVHNLWEFFQFFQVKVFQVNDKEKGTRLKIFSCEL